MPGAPGDPETPGEPSGPEILSPGDPEMPENHLFRIYLCDLDILEVLFTFTTFESSFSFATSKYSNYLSTNIGR